MRLSLHRVFPLAGLLIPAYSLAKPLSIQPDKVLKQCKWAAEVTIDSVVAPDASTKAVGAIHVRVTEHAGRTYKGANMASRKLVVAPPALGAIAATSDLAKLAGNDEPLLMVVDENDQVRFVGKLKSTTPERSFLLRSWYDYNAWWIFSTDEHFGTKVEMGDRWATTLIISVADIRKAVSAGPPAVK